MSPLCCLPLSPCCINHVSEISVYENVAALTSQARCSGASSGLSVCDLTLDGGLQAWDSAWVAAAPSVGQWLKVQLADTFTLIGGRLMQRLAEHNQIQNLTMDFGHGNTQQVGDPMLKHCFKTNLHHQTLYMTVGKTSKFPHTNHMQTTKGPLLALLLYPKPP